MQIDCWLWFCDSLTITKIQNMPSLLSVIHTQSQIPAWVVQQAGTPEPCDASRADSRSPRCWQTLGLQEHTAAVRGGNTGTCFSCPFVCLQVCVRSCKEWWWLFVVATGYVEDCKWKCFGWIYRGLKLGSALENLRTELEQVMTENSHY